MATYVIKSWRASNEPDANGNFVTILARKEGSVAWLLALLRIDPTVSLTVKQSRIEFSEGSMSGVTRRIIPMHSISSTLCGYHRPWKITCSIFLAMVLLCSLLAIVNGSQDVLVGGVFLGLIIAVPYYFSNRMLVLGLTEHSGVFRGIQFKPSLIEGQHVNEVQAQYACELIQAFIVG